MKHNYVIICLDSMFETFLVADEFETMKHNYINIWIQRLTYFGLMVNSYSRNSGMYLRFGCI